MAKSSKNGDRRANREVAPSEGRPKPSVNEQLEAEVDRAIGPVVDQPQRGQVVERVSRLIRSEIFSGPLPPPRHLAEYEAIHPGLADRITKMAEVAQERGEDRLDHIIDREFDDRRIGMYLGFAALAILVICGTALFVAGHPVAGGSLVGAAVIGTVVTSFIRGRDGAPDSEAGETEERKNKTRK